MTKDIQKWADTAMFTAEPSDASEGIKVYLLQGTPDPLGSVAAFSAMYTGEVVRDKGEVTDEERRFHLKEMQATKLKAPLEAITIHFMVEGVTRAFTHQMVRQRTAVYAQESLRFAVKEDAADAVALPPYLAGTQGLGDWFATNQYVEGVGFDGEMDPAMHPAFDRESPAQQTRLEWDYLNRDISDYYNRWVNRGMPAEDARGILPHNITTRLNYATNLRNLQDHSGNRLCTQAQFEWRMFWVKLVEAMRDYCTAERFDERPHFHDEKHCDNWQWQEIANLFRPVCYFTGQCEFKAKFDRKCSIRERVDANADINRPSSEWGEAYATEGINADTPPSPVLYNEDVRPTAPGEQRKPVFIGGISPAEWLMDDGAAR